MTQQHEGPRGTGERPVGSRRGAFASASPRHPPIAAAPSAASANIPDKLYFRIGEVASLCNVETYVLRFWETEFPQLRPNKGGTGQRLFRRRDVETALRIRHLLYDEGYTIPGARQLLRSEARPRDPQLALPDDAATQQLRADRLRTLHRSLLDLHALLAQSPGTSHRAAPLTPEHTQPRRPLPAKRPAPPSRPSLFEAFEPKPPGPAETP